MAKKHYEPFRIFKRGKIYHTYISVPAEGAKHIILRESTGCMEAKEAEFYSLRRIKEIQEKLRRKRNGELERMTVDEAFVKYLRDIKKSNPAVKIIYEIPTYPYGEDDRYNLSNFMFLLKERICRIRAAKYMDRIVTFYGQDSIWGVPCLKLMNGYDFSSVALPNREKPQTIELISVASTASWHGYDRVFKGLREYYDAGGTEIINFHVVGTILAEHEKMVSDLKLENRVIFHGKLFGDALYDIYQNCSIGIDVLGGYRIGYTISSSLKSREYAAYGMPLITASPVDYLPEDCPYQLILPNNDEPIDMQKVVAFFHELYDGQDIKQLTASIRDYGIQKIDMHVTMGPILKYIGSN